MVAFRKGSLIYREGLPAEGVFLLCRGSVKLIATADSGVERITDFVTCGQLFGLDALLPDPIRCISAVARENSQGAFIPSTMFKKTLQLNPDLLWHVTLMLNELLHRANYEKLRISGGRVRDRIANVLCEVSERLKQSQAAGKPTFAKLKQRELAELLGVPEETICRELRKMRVEKTGQLVSIQRNADSRIAAVRTSQA
jgi:CRP/FNR family transcriptional regulator, cyclic AMP receptor protein